MSSVIEAQDEKKLIVSVWSYLILSYSGWKYINCQLMCLKFKINKDFSGNNFISVGQYYHIMYLMGCFNPLISKSDW